MWTLSYTSFWGAMAALAVILLAVEGVKSYAHKFKDFLSRC